MSWIFDTKWKKNQRKISSEIWPLEKQQELIKEDPRRTKKNLIQGVLGSTFAILLGSIMLSQNNNGIGWILIAIGIAGEIAIVSLTHNKLTDLEYRIERLEEKL